MEASSLDTAAGDKSISMQTMETAQDNVSGDTTPTKTTLSDEPRQIPTDIELVSSHVFAADNKKPLSDNPQETITNPISISDQHEVQDLTRNVTVRSANFETGLDSHSNPLSQTLEPILQSKFLEKNQYMNAGPEGNDAALLIQETLPVLKDEVSASQLSEALPTGILLDSENIVKPFESGSPPAPPVTALAPLLGPTAAICDGSLDIAMPENAGIIVSNHACDSQLPPNDAGKPHPHGVSGPQRSAFQDFAHGQEMTLDELVQRSRFDYDQKPATIKKELDESMPASSEDKEMEAHSLKFTAEPIQGGSQDLAAEFELDSSPMGSSSSDTSDDESSSDDDDDDDDDDYKMLDPAEQAARLMQEDGGSDDEGMGKAHNGAGAGPPRTLNEKPDEVVPKPDLIITENMKIEELGYVENLVENLVLIKAKTTGEYQVLEFGSVLCLENRTVIGVVAETLGRVEQPYYAVHFTNEKAIAETGISKGTNIFYVEEHSTSVFTQPLKSFKGSDASNLHDEEVGDEGIEFSDDEAEAEYKRKQKLAKQAKRDIREGSKDGFSRGGRQRRGKIQKRLEEYHPAENGTSHIDYGGPDAGEELYTPLTRPLNLHEIMGRREAPLEDQKPYHRTDRGGEGGRGKGDRGRGRGDRGRASRGYGGYRGNTNGSSRTASEPKRPAQAPGGGFAQGAAGTDFYPLPPSNDLLPSHPTRPDASSGYYPAAGQSQMRPLTPSIQQSGPQHLDHQDHFDQRNNHHNQPSLYASGSQTSYNPSHSHPPYYQPQPQPPPSQYLPPSFQHQQPMAYPPYHMPPPSPLSPNVPAGTFINPAFFPSPAQPNFPHWPQVNPTQQPAAFASAGNSSISPESERAFQALNVLRNLSSGDGSHPT
jgi:H/ACA ribonucleoprotein complex non-core subunit NAF1